MRTIYTNQNPLFCRVPINSIYGFILGTYKIVGFGWFRYIWGIQAIGIGGPFLGSLLKRLDTKCLESVLSQVG